LESNVVSIANNLQRFLKNLMFSNKPSVSYQSCTQGIAETFQFLRVLLVPPDSWYKLAFLICLVGVIGCSKGPPYTKWDSPQPPLNLAIAPGVVTVDVLGINKPLLPFLDAPEQYWTFGLQLNTGTLDLKSWETYKSKEEEKLANLEAPGGHIDSCKNPSAAISRDGQYSVRCEELKGPGGTILENGFVVTDTSTHADVLRKQLDPSRVIQGYAWSPDSQAVAILSSCEQYDPSFFGLTEKWQRLSSYPWHTYYLTVFNVKSGQWGEFTIRRDVPKGWARILGWAE
jgi:hypothetical protein